MAGQTVKTHIGRLRAKLGARDRARLVVFAYETPARTHAYSTAVPRYEAESWHLGVTRAPVPASYSLLYRTYADDLARARETQRKLLGPPTSLKAQLDDIEEEITYLLVRDTPPRDRRGDTTSSMAAGRCRSPRGPLCCAGSLSGKSPHRQPDALFHVAMSMPKSGIRAGHVRQPISPDGDAPRSSASHRASATPRPTPSRRPQSFDAVGLGTRRWPDPHDIHRSVPGKHEQVRDGQQGQRGHGHRTQAALSAGSRRGEVVCRRQEVHVAHRPAVSVVVPDVVAEHEGVGWGQADALRRNRFTSGSCASS